MKKFISIMLVVLMLTVVGISFVGCDGESESSRGVTLAEYERLYVGMSYEDAMEIIGNHATRTSEVGEGQFHTVLYSFTGRGSVGANGIVTFQGSPLVIQSLTQVGLN